MAPALLQLRSSLLSTPTTDSGHKALTGIVGLDLPTIYDETGWVLVALCVKS